jgi:hypothetical protein
MLFYAASVPVYFQVLIQGLTSVYDLQQPLPVRRANFSDAANLFMRKSSSSP